MFDDATGCQVVAEQLARGGSASQAAAALVRGGRGRRGRDRAFPFFFFENPSLNFLPLAFPLPPPPSLQVSASYQAGSSDNISAVVLRLRRR